MAVHINLWGGPGSGKSTLRSDIFCTLKKKGLKIEEVHEYAKELTYDENFVQLSNQVLILGKQYHPHFVLDQKVDYIVTDSPFLMGSCYASGPGQEELKNLALKLHRSFKSIDILMKTHEYQEYQEYGRNQSKEQAQKKHEEIKEFLISSGIDFIESDQFNFSALSALSALSDL